MNKVCLRVLFVPDYVDWITGTIARNIAQFNPWIEATIASGACDRRDLRRTAGVDAQLRSCRLHLSLPFKVMAVSFSRSCALRYQWITTLPIGI